MVLSLSFINGENTKNQKLSQHLSLNLVKYPAFYVDVSRNCSIIHRMHNNYLYN